MANPSLEDLESQFTPYSVFQYPYFCDFDPDSQMQIGLPNDPIPFNNQSLQCPDWYWNELWLDYINTPAFLDTFWRPADTPPNAIYTCEICPKLFPKRYLLNQHANVHKKPVSCPVHLCTHHTATTRDIKRHIAAQHPGYHKSKPRPLCPVSHCEYARRGFARKDHVIRHIRTKHPELTSIECWSIFLMSVHLFSIFFMVIGSWNGAFAWIAFSCLEIARIYGRLVFL